MAPDFSTAIASLTTASKILKSMRQIKADAEIAEKVMEVQGIVSNLHSELLDVRTQYSQLLDSKNEVLAKLKKHEDWDAKEAQYEYKEVSRGCRVMARKDSPPTDQTPLYFCPNCFQDHKESVLQGIDVEAVHYECTAKCGFVTPRTRPMPPPQIKVDLPGLRGGGMR